MKAITVQNGPLAVDLGVFKVRVLDGGVVVRDEDLLEELYGERALPHAAVSHHHQLIRGQVVPGNHAGRHGDSYTCNTEEMLRDERRCHQFNGSTCKRSVCLRTE